MSMRFLVVLSVSGFHFGSKFGRPDIHFLYIRLFARCFFPSTSCIFIFTIATIFARDSRQQYPLMHKCNSTLNTLSSIDSQSDCGFTFSYAILQETHPPIKKNWVPIATHSFSVPTHRIPKCWRFLARKTINQPTNSS